MRVWHVHVSARLGPVNGVVQAMHQMAEAQRAHGLDVDVLHGSAVDPRSHDTIGSFRGLRAELAARRGALPDVVHLHELFRPPHLALAPLLRTVPYVVSTHGATERQNLARFRWRKAVYGRLVEQRLLRRAGAVVALTQLERRQIRAWLPSAPPIHVVANVADPGLLAAPPWRPSLGDGPPTLVCLARWDVRHKGLDRLAALAEQLSEVRVAVHGSPCGNGPELLAALRAGTPVLQFAPPVTGEAKEETLRQAAGFVLLSRWEGLSMALLEAMALGVPCFVSREVAATLSDPAPVIVLPDAPAVAAATVRRVLGTRHRTALGRAGRDWARRQASPAAVAAAMAQVYEAACAARQGGGLADAPHAAPAGDRSPGRAGVRVAAR